MKFSIRCFDKSIWALNYVECKIHMASEFHSLTEFELFHKSYVTA